MVDGLKKNWKKFGPKNDKTITVDRAVNILMETSHWKKETTLIKAEIVKLKKTPGKLPEYLNKTLIAAKKGKKIIKVEEISVITGRKEITERLYLDKLVKKKILFRKKDDHGNFVYSVKK